MPGEGKEDTHLREGDYTRAPAASSQRINRRRNAVNSRRTIVLKVSDKVISEVFSDDLPGPLEDGCFVRIDEVPSSISLPQFILFFGKRVKQLVSITQSYEFDFSEL